VLQGKQVPILLSSVGTMTYSLLSNLTAPDTPAPSHYKKFQQSYASTMSWSTPSLLSIFIYTSTTKLQGKPSLILMQHFVNWPSTVNLVNLIPCTIVCVRVTTWFHPAQTAFRESTDPLQGYGTGPSHGSSKTKHEVHQGDWNGSSQAQWD